MRLVFRVDGGPQIGGGHIMRCLTLAAAARDRGHEVAFVSVRDPLTRHISQSGFALTLLAPEPCAIEDGPPHASWLRLPWREDAVTTVQVLKEFSADWLVWDHYGLDGRWAETVVRELPDLKVLALDDLDDRNLGSDLLLDQTRMGSAPRHYAVGAVMTGPEFAVLRPEFQAGRADALARRGGPVRKVLIAPGMMDDACLAPLALRALEGFDGIEAEVVMGSASQSRAAVESLINGRADRHLVLDAGDMARRISDADLCIGAGGMTTWERCCLGLPSVLVAVAVNQRAVAEAVAKAGAALTLTLEQARKPGGLATAVSQAIEQVETLSTCAARLCDGGGADRVLNCMEGSLRPVTADDADRLYAWRMSPRVRVASLSQEEFSFDSHQAWLSGTLERTDGLWMIYGEPEPVGFVSAVDRGNGSWVWSFYIGAQDAAKGAGGRMLSAFLRHLWANSNCDRLEAVVLKDNRASERLHRKFGFEQIDCDQSGALAFRLHRGPRTKKTKGNR